MKYKLLIFWLAAKKTFSQGLGSKVKYKGKVWKINNGVMPGYWDLIRDGESSIMALRSDCRRILTPKNLAHNFTSTKRFYTGYWLDIWKREGIKDWMKALDIW